MTRKTINYFHHSHVLGRQHGTQGGDGYGDMGQHGVSDIILTPATRVRQHFRGNHDLIVTSNISRHDAVMTASCDT